jgi:hypothetical protein
MLNELFTNINIGNNNIENKFARLFQIDFLFRMTEVDDDKVMMLKTIFIESLSEKTDSSRWAKFVYLFELNILNGNNITTIRDSHVYKLKKLYFECLQYGSQ